MARDRMHSICPLSVLKIFNVNLALKTTFFSFWDRIEAIFRKVYPPTPLTSFIYIIFYIYIFIIGCIGAIWLILATFLKGRMFFLSVPSVLDLIF